DAAYIEDIDRDFESVFPLGEHILHRHGAIIEKYLPCRRSLDAQLMFFRIHGNATEIPLHNKRGKVLVVIDFGKYDEYIGKAAIGDPHLLPVDEIMGPFRVELRAGAA